MSVEAITESMVAFYEGTKNGRLISKERVELMMISVNGTNLEHADSVTEAIMSK